MAIVVVESCLIVVEFVPAVVEEGFPSFLLVALEDAVVSAIVRVALPHGIKPVTHRNSRVAERWRHAHFVANMEDLAEIFGR